MIIPNDNPKWYSTSAQCSVTQPMPLSDLPSRRHLIKFSPIQNLSKREKYRRPIWEISKKFPRNIREISEKYLRNIWVISEKYLRPGSRSNGAAATPHFLLFQAQAYQSPDFLFLFSLDLLFHVTSFLVTRSQSSITNSSCRSMFTLS